MNGAKNQLDEFIFEIWQEKNRLEQIAEKLKSMIGGVNNELDEATRQIAAIG